MLVEVASGKSNPVPGIERDEEVMGWSADSKSVSVWNEKLPAQIYLVDVDSGKRRFVQNVEPLSNVGSMYARMVASSDAAVAAYRQRRGLYTIYIADGLK